MRNHICGFEQWCLDHLTVDGLGFAVTGMRWTSGRIMTEERLELHSFGDVSNSSSTERAGNCKQQLELCIDALDQNRMAWQIRCRGLSKVSGAEPWAIHEDKQLVNSNVMLRRILLLACANVKMAFRQKNRCFLANHGDLNL